MAGNFFATAMHIKSLIFYLLFFAVSNLNAQQRADSLLFILRSAQEDTSKVNALNALGLELMESRPDTVVFLADEAYALAMKLGNHLGAIDATYNKAKAMMNRGEDKEGLRLATEMIRTCDQLMITDDTALQNALLHRVAATNDLMATFSELQGNELEALRYRNEALQSRQKRGDRRGAADTHYSIGITYENQSNYKKGLEHYLEALKIYEALGHEHHMASILSRIGSVYEDLGDDAKALEFNLRVLKLSDALGNVLKSASLYGDLGRICARLKQFDKALEYYSKAFSMVESAGDLRLAAQYLGDIGSVYAAKGNDADALSYYFRALKLTEEIGNQQGKARLLAGIGNVHAKAGKFREAEQELQWAVALGDSIGALNDLWYFEESLSRLYDTTGRYELALNHYKRSMALKDTLFNQEKDKELTRKAMNYEFDQKESHAKAEQDKKDAIARKEMQRQKILSTSFIAGFAIMLLFAIIFFTQRNRIRAGKFRSDELLLNILPAEVADELKMRGRAEARLFEHVTVMFTDFKNFTRISEKLSAQELVEEIHTCFKAFDEIIARYNLEKIKTIGDSYMCAGGLPVANNTNPHDVVNAALEIVEFMKIYTIQREAVGKEVFEVRVGINSGPVVAGIVGVKKFAYDIWGNTVNVASRMESASEGGKVNISGATWELIKHDYNYVYRGKIEAKNKGLIDMYFVEGKS